MATDRQIEANRRNAPGGGPKTDEGKAVSCLNARTHGIFASALTEHDQQELHGLYEELADSIRPAGRIEEMLVEKLAHTYLRLQRCARAEAEHHILTWEIPRNREYALSDYAKRLSLKMHATYFDAREFEQSVKLFARYDKTLTGQFIQLLHEIERLQRMRLGESVAPPIVGRLTVETDSAE